MMIGSFKCRVDPNLDILELYRMGGCEPWGVQFLAAREKGEGLYETVSVCLGWEQVQDLVTLLQDYLKEEAP